MGRQIFGSIKMKEKSRDFHVFWQKYIQADITIHMICLKVLWIFWKLRDHLLNNEIERKNGHWYSAVSNNLDVIGSLSLSLSLSLFLCRLGAGKQLQIKEAGFVFVFRTVQDKNAFYIFKGLKEDSALHHENCMKFKF